MNHLTLPRFWQHYHALPEEIQELAYKNFQLLKRDPHHPSIQLKKVGKRRELWSARVGSNFRALATEKPDGLVWFWIGKHADYERLLG